ncbi:catechol O-methyltransferase [Exophiala viscosa]|uniref:catechol O-methyltransferase n=1 Tax=Exophiala viscosa TaxID=2486360 RepID=UPI002196267F|nr:catechol O-methyltransferase [Exophiala viscosa]
MLDGTSSVLAHRLQNAALLILSLIFLPFDTFILFAGLFVRSVFSGVAKFKRDQAWQKSGFHPRRILVTGVGMTKGLVLARQFHEAGHYVIGADFEPNGSLVCGRVSRSIKQFHPLRKPDLKSGSAPYVHSLLEIISREKIELWVSCSGVASAVEDGMAKEIIEGRTDCKAIQFDIETTQTLHEKHTFISHTQEIGLTIPETQEISSRAEAEKFLQDAPLGRKYIMKTIGVDDAVRADMTLLPKATPMETSKHIAKLRISKEMPWIIQQFIKGKEYCTHSLVVKGQVKAFVACPSAELLMHYEALPADSALSKAMLEFTKKYANVGGPGFTGHLSFDFMVSDEDVEQSKNITLYPIECNPRAHTAVALFNGTTAMVDGYLSVLGEKSKGFSPVIPSRNDKYYWVGHDLVTKVIIPTLSVLTLQMSVGELIGNYRTFVNHLLTWKDGTFDIWDPLPWWWLYHVYWPMQFLSCFRKGKKWSRFNVSTTKMFEC